MGAESLHILRLYYLGAQCGAEHGDVNTCVPISVLHQGLSVCDRVQANWPSSTPSLIWHMQFTTSSCNASQQPFAFLNDLTTGFTPMNFLSLNGSFAVLPRPSRSCAALA